MAVEYRGLGYVTVVAAGTPVPLSATQILTPGALIQAATTNAGTIYVGGTDLDATHRGNEIAPGGGLEIVGPMVGGIEEEFSLADILIDAVNSGDKVVVSYFIRK